MPSTFFIAPWRDRLVTCHALRGSIFPPPAFANSYGLARGRTHVGFAKWQASLWMTIFAVLLTAGAMGAGYCRLARNFYACWTLILVDVLLFSMDELVRSN